MLRKSVRGRLGRRDLLAGGTVFALHRPAGAQPTLMKPASVLPQGVAGARLTFNEEFSSFTADPDGKGGWRTRYFHGDRTLPSNHEAEFYADETVGGSPFSVASGILDIAATRQTRRAGLPYRSGLITSQTLFAQRYGYFEMRAKLPAGRGLWPAFWMLPTGGGWPPELDIMEVLGHEPDTVYTSVHWTDGGHKSTTRRIRVKDMSQGFHSFAASWQPDSIAWFFVGQEIARTPTPKDFTEPMYLLANLAVGGQDSWPGQPDARTIFPATMQIDWIRAYQF